MSQLEPHIIIFSLIKYPLERSTKQFSNKKKDEEPIDFLLCNSVTIQDRREKKTYSSYYTSLKHWVQ